MAFACNSAWGTEADLLIEHARVVDGTGGPPRDDVSILISGGRIIAIGPNLSASARTSIDAGGKTVLPGLIDAHMHLAAAPGSSFRHDSKQTIQELNKQHLAAYLANGVTTVLDPGTPADMVQAAQAWVAAGHPAPRYLTTGPMLKVPGGYGSDDHGPVRTPAEVEAKLDSIVAMGGVGVKIATERGYGPIGVFEVYPPDIRDAIVEGARRRKLPIYAHATSEHDAQLALDMNAHAIMHSPMGGAWMGAIFGTADLSDDFVSRVAGSGAYVVTTFSLLDTWPGNYDVARLDEPLVALTVPRIEMETARAPDAVRTFDINVIGYSAPWTYEFTRPWITRWLWTPANLRDGIRYSQRNVLKLHRAGVPIVVGTDAPSPWPEAIYHFHGPQTAREIELLGEAGLSNMEAIAAATLVSARMLGLDAEIGSIEPNKRADLLIVDGDPLADLKSLRAVRWTVKDGVAHTPEEWMAQLHGVPTLTQPPSEQR